MDLALRKLALLSATALGLGISTSASAQVEADSSSGEIIVTARRVEEKLQDVPISISVYTQEAITNRNIVNTADLATYTPSLSVNQRYGPEKASFAIRGFVQELGTAPSVGVYFADVVAPRGGGSLPTGNGVGIGSLFDLQNVQVLKGPQGTLFGRNTTGGAVLLVPRKPTDRLEGYVEGSAGNYDMWRVQAVANVPLSETFKIRLGIDRMKRDGYLKNHSGIGPSRLADADYTAARFSMVANLTPDLENYTIATYAKSDSNGVVPRMVDCNPATTFGALACAQINRQNARSDGWWDVESIEPDAELWSETWQVINTTTWQASDQLTVKNIVSYGEARERSSWDITGAALFLPTSTVPITVTRIKVTPGFDTSSQSTFTEELQLQGRSANDRLDWQAGGYYEQSDPIGVTSQSTPFLLQCADDSTLRCTAFGGNISRPHQKTWFSSKGLYAQATYRLTDQFSVTGGIRYTWDSMKHFYNAVAIRFPTPNTPQYVCSNTVRVKNPDGTFPKIVTGDDFTGCGVTFTAKSHKPTWVINLDYKPAEDVLLYAKWARGYRAGGVSSQYIYFETWNPEKVDAYELGAKTSFHGSAVRGYFNAAGFYNDFRNQQIQTTLRAKPDSGLVGGTGIINAGKSRIWGAELDAAVTFFDQLKLEAGYTYLNTRLQELVRPTLPADSPWSVIAPTGVVGGPLSLSPKHRFTVTGTYTLPLPDDIGEISLGATFVHTGTQVASTATIEKWGILPSSNLLNLNASWNDILGAPLDAAFFMTNATNQKFPVNVTGNYNNYGFEAQMTNVPRMWGMRLKYRFGS